MDTLSASQHGAVELHAVVDLLLMRPRALSRLRQHLGPGRSAGILGSSAESRSEWNLNAEVIDFFADEILNESRIVWSGLLVDPDDEESSNNAFPITIHEYEGIHYVFTPEHDPVGYFLSFADATNYMHANWEHIREK